MHTIVLAVARDYTLSPIPSRILTVLAGHVNYQDRYFCYPKITTLSQECICSRDTVKRCVAELVELGYIRIEYCATIKGRETKQNAYHFLGNESEYTDKNGRVSRIWKFDCKIKKLEN